MGCLKQLLWNYVSLEAACSCFPSLVSLNDPLANKAHSVHLAAYHVDTCTGHVGHVDTRKINIENLSNHATFFKLV